ncbi:glycyl-radical enzyme activating protein [Pectinatus haikarae]|uniref:glycyl-radical enzyme activating protein n=1 Tax=Pectinatus haikarae TaxID=349096 RepID=UPI0018C507A6|nr:glycyl-radical enzyme activating protein [Pectinatus haikarae]
MKKGLIFDIQRFSVNDGAGIRTTVFLKGCPLHCIWCQNPEGISVNAKLVCFASSCILCGQCAQKGDNAVRIEKKQVVIENDKVKNPDEYESICPAGALRMDSRWYELDELIHILKRDKVFFKYGGGVTLSGGEPFFQNEFSTALLQKLREEGIHTAVETSLYTRPGSIEKALPYIDTLFADFKIYDNDLHKKCTGVDNDIIKKNIKFILQSLYRDNVIIRTPLIPFYTAVPENLQKIAEQIVSWYEHVKYELLNYNPLAAAKYKHVDYDYCFSEKLPMYTAEQMAYFYGILKEAGIIGY